MSKKVGTIEELADVVTGGFQAVRDDIHDIKSDVKEIRGDIVHAEEKIDVLIETTHEVSGRVDRLTELMHMRDDLDRVKQVLREKLNVAL